jgi:hypothetical protein
MRPRAPRAEPGGGCSCGGGRCRGGRASGGSPGRAGLANSRPVSSSVANQRGCSERTPLSFQRRVTPSLQQAEQGPDRGCKVGKSGRPRAAPAGGCRGAARAGAGSDAAPAIAAPDRRARPRRPAACAGAQQAQPARPRPAARRPRRAAWAGSGPAVRTARPPGACPSRRVKAAYAPTRALRPFCYAAPSACSCCVGSLTE